MVQKKLPNCALRGKSIKLGTMIVLDGLIIFSYGPHPNTQGGEAQWVLGGEEHQIWHGNSTCVAEQRRLWTRISARGRILHVGEWGSSIS